jgi:ubiquinone/menaquinone biosynthesis C-methylase UbiE
MRTLRKTTLNTYDALAPWYDWLAKIVFGSRITDSQLVHIPLIHDGANILILGGGTGWLLEKVLLRSPRKVWYVEASSTMISLSKKKVPDNGYVVFVHGGLDSIPSSVKFDAVIANFFLDQFKDEEVGSILKVIDSVLVENGLLLVTDFQDNAFWKKAFLKMMYFFFNVTGAISNRTLPEWEKRIREQGFKPTAEAVYYSAFIKSVALKKGLPYDR